MSIDSAKECEIISESMIFVAECIRRLSTNIPDNTSIFINNIEQAKSNRIFLLGAGRSGIEARAFATRLMHLGFNARMMAGNTTPVPGREDLVIVISDSGNTTSVKNLVKEINNTKIITITTKKDSEIGNMSDMVIVMPLDINKKQKISLMGTIFETIMHVFLNAVIAELKVRSNISKSEILFNT